MSNNAANSAPPREDLFDNGITISTMRMVWQLQNSLSHW